MRSFLPWKLKESERTKNEKEVKLSYIEEKKRWKRLPLLGTGDF